MKFNLKSILLVVVATLVTSHGFAADLNKLDVALTQALDMAESEGADPRLVEVTLLAAVESSLTEEEVRKLFQSVGLQARSVIPGDVTIVTARGSLASVLLLSDEEAIHTLEGSQILFPEPSVSLGN